MKDRIKLIRSTNKLTLKSFGEKIGLHPSSVQRVENGIYQPTEQTIRAICSCFNVDRHWLETGEGEMYVRIETSSDLVARLASEKGLGPGGHALLRTVVRILEELGPEALDRIVEETIPAIMRESGIGDPDKVDELMAARASAPAEPKISG